MGAAASSFPKHEQAAATDVLGDEFPSGASFYLANGANGFKDCLAVDFNGQAKTKAIRDSTDRKWLVEYAGGDRQKIALKNVGTGKWLAVTNQLYGAQMFLHGAPVYWWVYKGAEPNTFWLSTTQAVDCFLSAWDNVPGSGKDVLNLTNRQGQGYGKGVELFDEHAAALSWRLDWTPQYQREREATPEGQAAAERLKAANTQAAASTQEGVCCDHCGEKCQVVQEQAAEVEQFKGQYGDCKSALEDVNEQKAQLDKREDDFNKRNSAFSNEVKSHSEKQAEQKKQDDALREREKALATREAALKQQEIDLQKRDRDLDARQDAVLADEGRSKPAQADKAAARKQKDEQAARTEETKRKNEEMRKKRQEEQAEAAKVKAENVELREKVSKLEDQARKSQQVGEGGADPAADLEKAKLQADLDHALEMVAELQKQQTPPASKSITDAPPRPMPYGFSIAPPQPRMPPYSTAHTTRSPPNKMPAFSTVHRIEPPKNTVPQKLIPPLR